MKRYSAPFSLVKNIILAYVRICCKIAKPRYSFMASKLRRKTKKQKLIEKTPNLFLIHRGTTIMLADESDYKWLAVI